MTEHQKNAEALITAQQKGLDQYRPVFMVGEQLKDILRREPESAELLAQDLQKKGMGLADAEKKIKARADEIHRNMKGGSACVPPWEAEDILRKFYGLPERTRGPGKEAAAASVGRLPRASGPRNDRTGETDAAGGKIIDLADFF